MRAIHDQFTRQMRNRLKNISIGLGIVRLLQDARRFDEARTTLCSLEAGFQGVAEKSTKPDQKHCKTSQLKRTAINATEARPPHSTIA